VKDQLKKLLYTKHFVDTPSGTIAEWRLSPWKVFFLLLSIAILLLLVYAQFFTPSPREFLGNVTFYAIIAICIIAVLWIVFSMVAKARKFVIGFILAFILILTFYYFLGTLLSYFGIMDFHIGGYSTWILIAILAGLGAKRIDGNLDRHDVGFALLVFIILLGANIPLNQNGGFLANLDKFLGMLGGWIP